MARFLFLAFIATVVSVAGPAGAQPVQSIRGVVTDQDTRAPLAGATVVIADSDPLVGAATDAAGRFRLSGVPPGRYALLVSYVGYEQRRIPEVLVTAGRETLVDVALRETAYETDEVIVTGGTAAHEPLDPLATASARLLRVEQAGRYGGAFDDPARLAGTLAGVASTLADNAVVVRGNAPKGLLWRMDGVEIPTPTHFANLLTFGGGGITALSTRMLADSDFFLGAFPAEYGGALAGVFDLRVRTGNSERREHAVRAGVIGLDASSEGPLARGYGGSYIANYRYSTFGLLGPLLPEDADAVRYQNLAFKLNLPASGAGTFSLFGIGGTDRSGQSPLEDPADWTYDRDREDVSSPTRFGALSLQHRLLLGGNGLLESSLTATGNGLRWRIDRMGQDGALAPHELIRSEQARLAAASTANLRLGRGLMTRTGLVVSRLGYRLDVRQAASGALEPVVDAAGATLHAQAFTQARLDVGHLSLTGGAHVQHLALTGETTLEPRAGLEWRPAAGHRLGLAYGLHAQRDVLSVYFAHPDNAALPMARAHHLVASYGARLAPHLGLTVEAYLQSLYRVPVVDGTSFSTLNMELDWFLHDPLAPAGRGRNAGVELTLERQLAAGWYGVFSGTVFSSRYRGGDGVWRPTRFDRGAVGALLAGREWTFRGDRVTRQLGINLRLSVLGGRRHAPVDEAASREVGEVVYDLSRAFELREPTAVYGDATVEYRINRARSALIWSLQLLNATGRHEFYGHRFNLRELRVEEDRERIVLPNLSVTLQW